MKSIFTIAKFTMKDLVTKKSFIISTIIILLFIIIGFNIPNIIDSFKEDKTVEGDSSNLSTVIISDPENIFENTLESLDASELGYKIELNNDREEINKKILDSEIDIDSALIITKTETGINYECVTENNSDMFSSLPESLVTYLTTVYQTKEFTKLNLKEESYINLYPQVTTSITAIGEEAKGNVLVMMFISIALFFAIYYTAFRVSSYITLEKTSKIIETLVVSTRPTDIILGKTLGIGLVGLLQTILIGGVAVFTAFTSLDREILESVIDLSFVTWELGLITIVCFILGYFVYAFLYALTGSTVSKPEDVQSANGPVAFIALAGFYLAYFTLMNPTSSINKFAAIFPFSSSFCLPIRYMLGLASTFEIITSIVVLLLTTVIISYISIRVYKNAILNNGTKLSVKDIVAMFKQKNKE